ncbi:hypothetical protein Tco_1114491, partial [Tanacetum coccineum]
PPLLLPSASRREDRPEVTLPPGKRLGIAFGPRYKVGESSSAAVRPARGPRADYGFVATMDREIRYDPEREVGYRITDSWDKIVETLQGAPVSIDTELGRHMTAFETKVRDRRAHAYTRHQIETEARLSREAWRRSMDASDLARREVMSLRTTVLGTGDHATRIGGNTTGAGYRTAGTTGTRWRSCTARAARGGWSTPVTTTPALTVTTTTTITNAQLQAMIDQGVTAALAARNVTRNGVDSHTSRMGVSGSERVSRECTYQDFMKCKPLYFKGTKGVVELTQWFERMETVFRISNCSMEN